MKVYDLVEGDGHLKQHTSLITKGGTMQHYVKPTVITYTEEQILKQHEVCAFSF